MFGRVLCPAYVGAQASHVPDTASSHVIRWYEALAVAGGVSAAFLADEPLQEHLQENRTATSDDLASFFRHFGQPEAFATASLGLIGAGLIAHQPTLTRLGGRVAVSIALSAAEVEVLKRVSGRARPDSGLGAFHFDPFSGSESFPSGHAAAAFALATSLGDAIHNTGATVGLYGLATGTAWSRLNDDRHWLSDVLLGAAIGITNAKLVEGHWRVFGLHPPEFLLDPKMHGVELAYRISPEPFRVH
jgi:membrane-associated phospholipid phosphatase